MTLSKKVLRPPGPLSRIVSSAGSAANQPRLSRVLEVCVGVTCHRGHVDDGAALFAVLFAHVLQSQVGSLYHRGLQIEQKQRLAFVLLEVKQETEEGVTSDKEAY